MKPLYFRGHKYNHYDTYSTPQEALNVARHYKKDIGCRYFINKREVNPIFPNEVYDLFLDKVEKGPLGLTIVKETKSIKRERAKENPLITIKTRKKEIENASNS